MLRAERATRPETEDPRGAAAPRVLGFPTIDSVAAAPPGTPPPRLEPEDARLIEAFRALLARSRLTGRNAIRPAWAATGDGSPDLMGLALMQALPGASARRLVFHAQGAAAPSLDELWLLRLLRSAQRGDTVNVRALLGFRLRRDAVRRIHCLVSRLARELDGLLLLSPGAERLE